ncbi:hypothetical protein C5B94_09930 [Clavibacter michiganensis]|uniref:DUF2997 domain-containing protein n=1 Tax=Clavibacter michiganensis TaxID=28447 RepID=UPI000CE780C6|nr:DUF2997 domain-containing protein [Clavibacter michiganensis]PPF53360.1 hypothetical protein C5B94_09930 [Clavibacter michiganensis]
MAKRIIVTLALDGTITAESTGVPGPACMDDATLIQDLLPHATIVESNLTPGYYQMTQTDYIDVSRQKLNEQDHA